MNEYKKVIILDESGIAKEYEKALVVSIGEKNNVGINLAHMAGLDIILAAYALVTMVDNLGLMPSLQKFLEEGRVELEDIRLVE